MFKKFLSYFLPINIYQKKSNVSRNLEVTWNNGQLVLDSANTNYSYGSLQRVLRKGLKYIGYKRIQNFESVLVLGVAGGSVIKTLVDEIQFKGKITGVEIDEEVVRIANDYFQLHKIPNFNLIVGDAFEYVLKCQEKYDLIIIDVFQDTTMPSFLFEDHFIKHIQQILNIEGFILFNAMALEFSERRRNALYKSKFNENYSVRMYPKIEAHNELFTIKKLS